MAITSANCYKQWLFHLPIGNQHLLEVVLTPTTTSANNISIENCDHHIIYGNIICQLAITSATTLRSPNMYGHKIHDAKLLEILWNNIFLHTCSSVHNCWTTIFFRHEEAMIDNLPKACFPNLRSVLIYRKSLYIYTYVYIYHIYIHIYMYGIHNMRMRSIHCCIEMLCFSYTAYMIMQAQVIYLYFYHTRFVWNLYISSHKFRMGMCNLLLSSHSLYETIILLDLANSSKTWL